MVALSLIVLWVADLDASAAFYRGLGLDLKPEQHGAGPAHYSAALDGTILELYPCGDRPPTRTRLGLRGVSGDGKMTDPDGNVVELLPADPGAARVWIVEWDAAWEAPIPRTTAHSSEAGARAHIAAVAAELGVEEVEQDRPEAGMVMHRVGNLTTAMMWAPLEVQA